MKRDEIMKRNLDLHAEWMRYVFEHPEVLDQIPQSTRLVIIPNNDPDLAAENAKIAKRLKAKGQPVVIVHIDMPKLPIPQIEVIAASC